MLTFTYYVQEFYKSDDPRPKFLAGETFDDLIKCLNVYGVGIDKDLRIDKAVIVTVKDEIKKNYLGNIDYCSICNDCYGRKCFCGHPVISVVPLIVSVNDWIDCPVNG